MDDFIVGGFIPGTNIQLPFWASLIIDALVIILLAYAWHKYYQQIRDRAKKGVDQVFEFMDKANYFLHPMVLSTAHKATILQLNIAGYYSHLRDQAAQAWKNSSPED
jgi:hypothetical protein